MPKDIDEMDAATRQKVWDIAGSIEWTAEDWKTFHRFLTLAFTTIAFRHAKAKIEQEPTKI